MSHLIKILNSKNTVKGATGLLIITLTLSNLLGLIRDRLFASRIPADLLDTYYAAFRLPDLLTNLIVVGAVAVTFIPLFTDLKAKDERQAWDAASAIFSSTVIFLMVGSGLLAWLMPILMPWVVPDFSPEKQVATIALSRWLTLTPVLFGASYILSGILQSYHRFVVYSFAPLVYNLSIILGILFLTNGFAIGPFILPPLGITGVVVGVLLGALLHFLIQLPVAVKLGWRPKLSWSFNQAPIRRLGGLMIPRLIGLLAVQIQTIVVTALASGWIGAIAYYNLANNIQTMPSVVFANSIATAVFPTLASSVAAQDNKTFLTHLSEGIRWILFLLIPATIILIIMRSQIIRLILGAGYFDWEATQTTADVLGWFAISLVASGLVALLARAFYARQDMKTPMTIALISALIAIILSFILPRWLPETIALDPSRPDYVLHLGGVAALSIAFSIGMIVNAVLLLFEGRRQLGLNLNEFIQPLTKILLSSVVLGILIQITKVLVGRLLGLDHTLNVLIQTVAALTAGGIGYLAMAYFLGCPEWQELRRLIHGKTSTKTSIEPV